MRRNGPVVWGKLCRALREIFTEWRIGVAVPLQTGWTMKFQRPVEGKFPVSARYGAKGPWWDWHIDGNNKWVQGKGPGGIGQHKGIDFSVPVGTPVYAMINGTVEASGWENPENAKQGFGLRIRQVFQWEKENWRAYYGHLSELRCKVGDFVSAGTLIGMSGDSGHATGPHLHVEIRSPDNQQHPIEFDSIA